MLRPFLFYRHIKTKAIRFMLFKDSHVLCRAEVHFASKQISTLTFNKPKTQYLLLLNFHLASTPTSCFSSAIISPVSCRLSSSSSATYSVSRSRVGSLRSHSPSCCWGYPARERRRSMRSCKACTRSF